MQETCIVTIKGVYKSFSDGDNVNQILSNADYIIHKADYLALIGRSGLGKSTLLKIIGCLERADSGIVSINGMNIENLSSKRMAKLRRHSIGFVFQQFNLIPRLSIKKNLELPLIFAGIPRSERNRRVIETLELLELAQKFQNQSVVSLSGGEKQRLAIGRAIINRPEIILADEPTGNLDEKNEQLVLELLESIKDEFGVALLVVTHDMNIASRAKTRITLMNGQIVTCLDERNENVIRGSKVNAN